MTGNSFDSLVLNFVYNEVCEAWSFEEALFFLSAVEVSHVFRGWG